MSPGPIIPARCDVTHVLQQPPQFMQHRLGVGEVLRHVHVGVAIYQKPVVGLLSRVLSNGGGRQSNSRDRSERENWRTPMKLQDTNSGQGPKDSGGKPRPYREGTPWIDQLQVEKSSILLFKTIVFKALISNILLSRLSDEQKCIFRILSLPILKRSVIGQSHRDATT